MTPIELPPTKWTIRRTFMFIVCLFCMGIAGVVTYGSVFMGVSNTLATVMGICSLVTVVTCVGSYTFGAAWEDIARLKVLGGDT